MSNLTENEYLNYDGDSGLLRAIKRAGGQKALAALLGVSQSTISDWLAIDSVRRKQVNADSGIAKAIESAGGQTALAALLGVRQQAVSTWLTQGYVPPTRATEIEMQLGVPRATLISPKLRNLADTGSGL
jgi:DNA-binding transcriptional regulator YdaS (Cro superfamily)